MLAQSEPVGVLEVRHVESLHYFSQAEQAAMQHLANQVATALTLQEQHSIREQLFRSEKAGGGRSVDLRSGRRAALAARVHRAAGFRVAGAAERAARYGTGVDSKRSAAGFRHRGATGLVRQSGASRGGAGGPECDAVEPAEIPDAGTEGQGSRDSIPTGAQARHRDGVGGTVGASAAELAGGRGEVRR